MPAAEITKDVYWVGVQNPGLRIFDVIMRTEWGTSYNSYLIRGAKKTALVDSVKEGFSEEFVKNISEVCDVSSIDYIVCNHTEPDHSGSLAKLLALAPDAVVLCSRPASVFLRTIINRDFECRTVGDGDSVDLGGKTLRFISTPYLHWPDSIFTWLPEEGVLLTGDAFGFHFSAENVFDDLTPLTDAMAESQKYYFDVIMGPFKSYVLQATGKIRDLDIKVIAPSHGPVLRSKPWEAVSRYESWSSDILHANDPKRVYIGYVSCYGYTRMLGERIAAAAREAGYDTELEDVSLAATGSMRRKDPCGRRVCDRLAHDQPGRHKARVGRAHVHLHVYCQGQARSGVRLVRLERRGDPLLKRAPARCGRGRAGFLQRAALPGREGAGRGGQAGKDHLRSAEK